MSGLNNYVFSLRVWLDLFVHTLFLAGFLVLDGLQIGVEVLFLVFVGASGVVALPYELHDIVVALLGWRLQHEVDSVSYLLVEVFV